MFLILFFNKFLTFFPNRERNFDKIVQNNDKEDLHSEDLDLRMDESDIEDIMRNEIENNNEKDEEYIPIANKESLANKREIENMVKDISESLGIDNKDANSFMSSDMWDKLLAYIMNNLKSFLKDGNLAIDFQMKYFACFYIVMFIPADIYFFFPRKITKLLPKNYKKVSFLREFVDNFNSFLDFIKKENNDGNFIVDVVFGRSNAAAKDIKKAVELIKNSTNDPIALLRFLFDFEIKNKRYKIYMKENVIKKKY